MTEKTKKRSVTKRTNEELRKRHAPAERAILTRLFIRRQAALGLRPTAVNTHTLVGFFLTWKEAYRPKGKPSKRDREVYFHASQTALDFYMAKIVEALRTVDYGYAEPMAKAAWEEAIASGQLLQASPTVRPMVERKATPGITRVRRTRAKRTRAR